MIPGDGGKHRFEAEQDLELCIACHDEKEDLFTRLPRKEVGEQLERLSDRLSEVRKGAAQAAEGHARNTDTTESGAH